MIFSMTGFSGVRDLPSSYRVTSPSKVMSWRGPSFRRPRICAVLRVLVSYGEQVIRRIYLSQLDRIKHTI